MTSAAPATAPLAGLRVLDLSRVLAGPWAAQVLADLGADVVKIERPGAGDDTRAWGPPYAEPAGDPGRGESAYFMAANRGKKSLAIDLKAAAGAALVRALAGRSDVLIENFKVGDLERYGLDAPSLLALHPALVYCSITGFGQTGPRAKAAGYDLMIQGMAGLMSITGKPDEVPGGEPTKVGVAIVDVLTGLYAVIGILAALAERRATGRGRHVDLALFDVCAASLANQAMNWLVGGVVPQRMGNRHPNIAPYQTYPAADGHLILAVGNDAQFRRFCALAGLAHLAGDPRFVTNSARVAHRDALDALIAPVIATAGRAEWLQRLERAGVPCGPINDLREVFADVHATARGLVRSVAHATLGEVPAVADPIRFDGVSLTGRHGAPVLGEHSRSVLRERLGLSEERIAALIAEGIVAQHPLADRDGHTGTGDRPAGQAGARVRPRPRK